MFKDKLTIELPSIYQIQPITSPFPAEKSKAWHNKIHPFYTKQPSNVVSEYIKHFCPSGGLVADTFCGSGVTAIEALSSKRRAICIDLDPLAVFITRMTCLSTVNLTLYWDAYRKIERIMKPIVKFVRQASPSELEDYKINEWYPKQVPIPPYVDQCNAEYVENLFGKSQLIVLSHLRSTILKIQDPEIKELLLFTFSGALDKVSIMYRAPEAGKKHGGGSALFMVYRYWVPKEAAFPDVWNAFASSASRVAKAKNASNGVLGDWPKQPGVFSIHCDSAENLLKYTPKNSVDYIYTDPPYGAHIAYLDLSTMWHAWLGMEVSEKMRLSEAIEAGQQDFDERHYMDSLGKAFEKMFYALKDGAWLSLVFHHKKTSLWYNLRDMLRYIGFEYSNTVAQPLSQKTFAKVKHPLRVLGESLIVNFQKTAKRKISQPMSLPLGNLIKNVAERVIYREGGATTEEILREVVPDLFDNDLFFDAASKNMNDIISILESDFELDTNKMWQIKTGRQVGNFIPAKDRIKYYIIGYLRKVQKANFDSIVTTILPRLANGHEPTEQDISDVLKEVAISHDRINWEIKSADAIARQGILPLSYDEREYYSTDIPSSTTHNQQIYRLAMLCNKAGFSSYIGKQERSDPMLSVLKPVTRLEIKASSLQQKRIEQIDIIWVQSDGSPVWAFEIEEHTSVLSALERFVALLSVAPELGKNRRLTIIAPKSRRKKLEQELTNSSYIGHPLYLENKITYIYYDELEAGFTKYRTKRTIQLADIQRLCKLPTSIEKATMLPSQSLIE